MRLSRIVSALLAGAAALGVSAAEAEDFRIAAQPTPLYAPLFVAANKGWLNEELGKASPGVAAKISLFGAGAPVNESFAAGQQDLGVLGDTPFIIGAAAGIERRIIGKASDGPKTIAVIVGQDSPIKTPADLKGRKVAVPKGTYTEHLLSLVLEGAGLSLKDIEQINLPNQEVAPAIVAGSVDAGAVWEPALTRFEAEKAVRVLQDGTGIKAGISGIVATPEAIAGKREQIKAFIRAYIKGGEFIAAHPEEAAELIAKDVTLPPALAISVFKKLDYNPVLTDQDIEEYRKTEAYVRSIRIIKRKVDIDAIVDRSIINELGLK